MTIINVNEFGASCGIVTEDTIETHLAARDNWSQEAALLRSFLDGEGEPYPESITDEAGDEWSLVGWEWSEADGCDLVRYEYVPADFDDLTALYEEGKDLDRAMGGRKVVEGEKFGFERDGGIVVPFALAGWEPVYEFAADIWLHDDLDQDALKEANADGDVEDEILTRLVTAGIERGDLLLENRYGWCERYRCITVRSEDLDRALAVLKA